MKNLSYHDAIQDEIYSKAFLAGQKSILKKYDTLKEAAQLFFDSYNSSFGEPIHWDEYERLKRVLSKPNP